MEARDEHKLLSIMNLDFKINNKFFHKVGFNDKRIEKLYQKHRENEKLFIDSDYLLIVGWICILIYTHVAFYRFKIAMFNNFLFLLSICLIFIKKNIYRKKSKLIDLMQVTIITIYLNVKAIYVNYLSYITGEDYVNEILRTIIYDFVSTNLLCLLILEENLKIRLIFLLMNLNSLLVSTIVSKSNHFYYIDGITSSFYWIIFYMLKKIWEYNLRSIFSERFYWQKLLFYSILKTS